MFVTAAVVALNLSAQASPVVVTADPAKAEVAVQQAGIAPMLNRAADLATRGNAPQARNIYKAIEKMPADYKLETTDGRWMYPAEIARRGLLAIDRQRSTINLAVR